MANASAPQTYALGAVTVPGTSVALNAQPPDNCHTIFITNPSSTVVGLIGQGTAGTALTGGVNATRGEPGAKVWFVLGTIANRGAMTNWVADSIGGAVSLEVTYNNLLGGI